MSSSRSSVRPAAPRALVVAYDFPPHGAIGTMRTLRLVRELHGDGWSVTVLTGSPETYLPGTPVERGLEAMVPDGVDVLQVRAVRPYNRLESLIRGVRSGAAPAQPREVFGATTSGPPTSVQKPSRRGGLRAAVIAARDRLEAGLDIPDKESGWIMPAIARGLRHMSANGRPDVIYSSAPPWSGQVVALALARYSRRPWVADFRDPWSRAPWREWVKFRQRAVAALERRVIRRADAVLFVTEANRAEFAAHYGPSIARKLHLVPNGCDPTELEAIAPLPPRTQFVMLHAGTFYGARTPMPIIQAMARAVDRGALDRSAFRLRLLGNINLSIDVPSECARLGVSDMVELVSRVTRAESLSEMKSASALLLVQTGTTVSVPGKAYEYLAAGRPVLALSDEGETSALVRSSGIGVSVRPDAPIDEIEAGLLQTVAIARGPFAPCPPDIYDGRIHARTTGRMLREFAGPAFHAPRAPLAGLEEQA